VEGPGIAKLIGFVFGEPGSSRLVDGLAIRALEVRELTMTTRALGSPRSRAGLSNSTFGFCRKMETPACSRSCCSSLRELLILDFLQQLLKLRPQFVERPPQLLLLHNIKGLQFGPVASGTLASPLLENLFRGILFSSLSFQ